ncbi:MAG: methyltransferase domain-containing protein [Byssovorax sp.]
MKRAHFEAIAPICALCRQTSGKEAKLSIGRVIAEENGDIREGILVCTDPGCQREYPILDHVPILVPALRAYVAQNVFHLLRRDDLSPVTESLLGDCCGPGSVFDQTRQHLSSYAHGHYADRDPGDAAFGTRSTLLGLLDQGLPLAGPPQQGPILDAGCGVGRSTFELADRTGALVVGVDLNFSFLRLASRALREGIVRYDLRKVGLVYEERAFPVRFDRKDLVDFWAADALSLPFAAGSFGQALSLNLLDCVSSPYDLLASFARVLRPGARAILASPYDWSPGATPIEAWIGGHSQRGPEQGSPEAALRSLLTPGAHPASLGTLRLVGEAAALPWAVRVHDRSTMLYGVHLVIAERTAEHEGTQR